MRKYFIILAIAVCAIFAFGQEQLSDGELRTIVRCIRHRNIDLLGKQFRGEIRVRSVWTSYDRHMVLFFAFRTLDERFGRVMEFVPEGKRPNRHFTMSNDANFDGKTWVVTSDPLGGEYSHQMFDRQIRRLASVEHELQLSLNATGSFEGACDSYVHPDLSE